jgi:hypothetical protein
VMDSFWWNNIVFSFAQPNPLCSFLSNCKLGNKPKCGEKTNTSP